MLLREKILQRDSQFVQVLCLPLIRDEEVCGESSGTFYIDVINCTLW